MSARHHVPRLKRDRPLYPIAVSPTMAAHVLGIHKDKIYSAINDGELSIYTLGAQRRVLIADIVDWIRATWNREPVESEELIDEMIDYPGAQRGVA
jgi:excisionase family DNA binding protein